MLPSHTAKAFEAPPAKPGGGFTYSTVMDKNTFMSKNLWLTVQLVFTAHLRSGSGAGGKRKVLLIIGPRRAGKTKLIIHGLYYDLE